MCVGFPLVVPSTEGFAVELGTLGSSEVHSVLRTVSGVTQFIRARQALAKPAAIHRSERKEKKRHILIYSNSNSNFIQSLTGCQAAVMFVVVMRCIANEIKMSVYFDKESILLTLKMKFLLRKSLYIKCSSA